MFVPCDVSDEVKACDVLGEMKVRQKTKARFTTSSMPRKGATELPQRDKNPAEMFDSWQHEDLRRL